MHVHFKSAAEWKALNEEVASRLGVDLNKHEVRLYASVPQAIFEASVGLRRLYVHKKNIFFVKDQDPHFEAPMQALAKEGLQLTALPLEALSQHEEFIAGIGRDTHFLLYAADDPVLGRKWPVEPLEASLQDKTIFKIRVSYARHFFEGLPPLERNSVQIFGLPNGMAIVLLGERVRFPSQGVEFLNWTAMAPRVLEDSQWTWLTDRAPTFSKQIDEFESLDTLGFKPVLQGERLFDRAVISWPDMDGFAFLHFLSEELGQPLAAPGQDSRFETTSLSRWGGLRTMDWLLSWGLSPEIIRGLVIVDGKLLSAEFTAKVGQVRKRVLEAQNGGE